MDFNYIKQLYHERKLSKAELKKREEIAQAIERENPDIEMGKKMAIATATAKKAKDVEHIIDEISRFDLVVTFMRAHGLDPYKLKGAVGKLTRERIKNSAAFKAWLRLYQNENYEMSELEELEQIDEFFSNLYSAAVSFAKEKGIPLLKKVKGGNPSTVHTIMTRPSFPTWVTLKKQQDRESAQAINQSQQALYASYIEAEFDQILSEKNSKEKSSNTSSKNTPITFLAYPDKIQKNSNINNKDEARFDDNYLNQN